ncbi:MAG: hypothetical protein ABIW48_04640 [Burkholderiales bacterium]
MSEKPPSLKSKPAAMSYQRRVFINCPFDNDYLPLLQAIAFAVIDCGFSPRLAIQEVNGRLRLEKMIDLMRESRLSIHDISRLPARPGELPRFNMPFECGVFVGLKESGAKRHRDKQFLVLDEASHQHQRTMSDVAGLDPKVHGKDPRKAIDAVRHFLASELRQQTQRQESAPGGASIWQRYQSFLGELPSAVARAKLSAGEILSFDYLSDLVELMGVWIKARP